MHPVTGPTRKDIVPFLIALALVYFGFMLFLYVFDPESNNYVIYEKLHSVAKELKEYKKENGAYPKDILSIRSTDKLCVTRFFTHCRKIYYKPSQDLQDFRIAMYSFSWGDILFYDPKISMTTEEYRQLPKTEQDRKPYLCFYCEAYAEWYLPFPRNETPIYRKDTRIFPDPDEWPKLW